MQKNVKIVFFVPIFLLGFLGLCVGSIVEASQYALFNPGIGPASLKTGTQPFTTMSISGSSANPVLISASSIDNIAVGLTYSPAAEDVNVVNFSIDFTKLTPAAPIPAAAIKAGISVQIALVEAANMLSYPNVNSIQKAYYWNSGPTATNTVIVMLVGADGTVYAAGATDLFFIPTFAPISYQVAINAGLPTQSSTIQIPITGSTTRGVKIQSGIVSSPQFVTYPLINSTIWGTGAPTNPTAFGPVSILGNAQNSIVLGVDTVNNISINFDYTATSINTVTYSIDLTQNNAIPASVLQAGLFVKIDLVPSADSAAYPSVNLIQPSYFWGGPGSANTMFVSLVDAAGNIYAAGGCAGTIASQYVPTAYSIVVNSSSLDQLSTLPIPITSGTAQGVMIQVGAVSSPSTLISYPLFMSGIWNVATPTTSPAFTSVLGQITGDDIVTLDVTDVDQIQVAFNYGASSSAVTFTVDVANIAKITSDILETGLFIKTDLVPAANVSAYPGISMVPTSYFYGGPSNSNTMIVSLVDAKGTIYAIGACTGTIASDYIPTNYVVTVQSKNNVNVSTAPVPFDAATVPAVEIVLQPTIPPTHVVKGSTATGDTAGTLGAQMINLLDVHRNIVAEQAAPASVVPSTLPASISFTPLALGQSETFTQLKCYALFTTGNLSYITLTNATVAAMNLVLSQGTAVTIGLAFVPDPTSTFYQIVISVYNASTKALITQETQSVYIWNTQTSMQQNKVPFAVSNPVTTVNMLYTSSLHTSQVSLGVQAPTGSPAISYVTFTPGLVSAGNISISSAITSFAVVPNTNVGDLYSYINLSPATLTLVNAAIAKGMSLQLAVNAEPNSVTAANYDITITISDQKGNVVAQQVAQNVTNSATPGVSNTANIASGAPITTPSLFTWYAVSIQLQGSAKAVSLNVPGISQVVTLTPATVSTLSLPTLGALSYSALKTALSAANVPVTETTAKGALTTNDNFSFAFSCPLGATTGCLGFAIPTTSWSHTAVPNLYTLLNAVPGFNLSTGVTYLMLAFDVNNNLITDVTKIANVNSLNFYLFAYDVNGKSLLPSGVAVPVATMGNNFNNVTVLSSNQVSVDLNGQPATPGAAAYPVSLIVT